MQVFVHKINIMVCLNAFNFGILVSVWMHTGMMLVTQNCTISFMFISLSLISNTIITMTPRERQWQCV